eukprot:3419591-Rhodomonas_salina.3
MNKATECKTKRLVNLGPSPNQDWDASAQHKAKRKLLANRVPGGFSPDTARDCVGPSRGGLSSIPGKPAPWRCYLDHLPSALAHGLGDGRKSNCRLGLLLKAQPQRGCATDGDPEGRHPP